MNEILAFKNQYYFDFVVFKSNSGLQRKYNSYNTWNYKQQIIIHILNFDLFNTSSKLQPHAT